MKRLNSPKHYPQQCSLIFSQLSLSLSLSLPFVRLVIFLPVCMIIASFNTKILQSILIAKFLLDFLFYCLVKMEIGLYIKR